MNWVCNSKRNRLIDRFFANHWDGETLWLMEKMYDDTFWITKMLKADDIAETNWEEELPKNKRWTQVTPKNAERYGLIWNDEEEDFDAVGDEDEQD